MLDLCDGFGRYASLLRSLDDDLLVCVAITELAGHPSADILTAGAQ